MRVITPDHSGSHDDNDEYVYPREKVFALIEEQIKVGNYEPCVQAMVLIQKQLNIDPWTTRESDVRKDVWKFRRQLRLIDRVLYSFPIPNNRVDESNWDDMCVIIAEIKGHMCLYLYYRSNNYNNNKQH